MARFPSRNAQYADGQAEGLFKREIPRDSIQWAQSLPILDGGPLLNDKQQAYADALNAILQATNVPVQVQHSRTLVEPDYNWGNYVDNMNSLRNSDDERLAFLHSIQNANPAEPDYYGAGVDNLNAILGDNYYQKQYDLPLGITGELEYDGDTLSGGLNVPSKQYYAARLLDLLRGK